MLHYSLQYTAKNAKHTGLFPLYYLKNNRHWNLQIKPDFSTKILLFHIDDDQHNFKSLSSLQEGINKFLQTQLKVTTEKINEVYDLDKKIWRELDDQEQTCEKLVKQIQKLRKEGVSLASLM